MLSDRGLRVQWIPNASDHKRIPLLIGATKQDNITPKGITQSLQQKWPLLTDIPQMSRSVQHKCLVSEHQ